MRKRLLVVAILLVAAVALRLAAGEAAEGQWLLRSELPDGPAAFHYLPELRYPPGSRVVRVDSGRPEMAPQLLSQGMYAAGGVSLSADASQVLFLGKESASSPYSVWRCAPDGGQRRRAVDTTRDCGAAAFLPDGRIVYSAETGQAAPQSGTGAVWALFVAAGDGSPGRRITWAEGLELDPSVLRDGRILYSRWLPEGDGRPAPGAFALFTVHPDGSGAAPLHGFHEGPPAKLLPRQDDDGDFLYLGGELGATAQLYRADRRFPSGAGQRLAADDPAWPMTQTVAVAARPRPQGHLGMVDPDGDRGGLLCLDARTASGEGVSIRLRDPRATVLGQVELEADGSFYVLLPADRPLLLDLLDRRGRVIRPGRVPFWVRPGETRCCVGCHEEAETAPPNRRPLAVLKDPVPLDFPSPLVSGQ